MITRTLPNGFLKARYLFTNSPDLENNILYNMKATAVNKEGVVLSYCYRKEQWKNLKVNYDSQYPVAYIRSKAKINTGKDFRKTLLLHKLVYFTFADIDTSLDYSKYEINHIDHNKKNPRYENLELCTKSENQRKYQIFSKGGDTNNISTTIPLYKPNTNQLTLDI